MKNESANILNNEIHCIEVLEKNDTDYHNNSKNNNIINNVQINKSDNILENDLDFVEVKKKLQIATMIQITTIIIWMQKTNQKG